MIKKSIPLIIPALLGVFVIWWLIFSLAHLPYAPHRPPGHPVVLRP